MREIRWNPFRELDEVVEVDASPGPRREDGHEVGETDDRRGPMEPRSSSANKEE